MPSLRTLQDSWIGLRVSELLTRIAQLELLDRSYTLAAQTFVAVLPLILVIAAGVAGEGEGSVVAEELVERFGLVGAAARATRDLIVVTSGGVYWLGALLTLYAAFALSKRASRAYNAIWGTPQLTVAQQWRGLVWIALQVVSISLVTELRGTARHSGNLAAAGLIVLVIVVWAASELLTQTLFTRGAVPRRRILVAVAFVTMGKIGLVVWAGLFLALSLARQAEAYGPIGVVFALFTALLSSWIVLLGATLLAAVLTDPELERNPSDVIIDVHAPGGAF